MRAPQLVLASASPRRQQLLAEAGYTFVVHPSDVDEQSVGAGLGAGELAERLAEMKADEVSRRFPDDVVLAADTVVAYLDRILGKPRDERDAERMLRLLSGTAHSVITGVAVFHRSAGHFRHSRVLSAVHMRELTEKEVHAYVASRMWEGKAGGYGIQDPDPFVSRTSGSGTNIVGLPMELVAEMLEEVGVRASGARVTRIFLVVQASKPAVGHMQAWKPAPQVFHLTPGVTAATNKRMQNVVIDKPYVPVPPYRGKIWAKLLSLYAPHMLRKKYGVDQVQCVNADRLRASISAGHGVLITPNHSRDEDPFIVGELARQAGSPLFIMASWHLFMQDKLKTFMLRRAGAFSIYREGIDRSAVNTAVDILATAERPLVIFPEGFISRTNDRINDLMDGTALIARSAAKRRAKLEPAGKVVVHPVALRYTFHGDINAAVARTLDEIEARLSWRPQRQLQPLERIFKVGGALLALKELEYLGHTENGDLGARLNGLINGVLEPLEKEWLEGKHEGIVPARVKKLRTAILPDMTKGELDENERERRWIQLADLYLAQQLFNYPPDYVKSNPSTERLLETIERFEEDLTDKVRLHGPIHATVTVGEAIEVPPNRESRGAGDPLMDQIDGQLRGMLNLPHDDRTK